MVLVFHLHTTPLKYLFQTLKKITSKAEIHLQLESKNVALSEILSEWTFLKRKLAKWSKNDFPPESWESTGMNFDGLSNLFGLIDYFLILSVSSAKVEHGFLILKSLKPSKQAVLTNWHLQQQMLVNIDGPGIESFKPHESINIGTNIVHLNIEMGRLLLNDLLMETCHMKSLDHSPSKQNWTLATYKTKTAQYFLEDVVYSGLHFASPNSNKLPCFCFCIIIYIIFFHK